MSLRLLNQNYSRFGAAAFYYDGQRMNNSKSHVGHFEVVSLRIAQGQGAIAGMAVEFCLNGGRV